MPESSPAPQAKGNTILAGTGGQATALVAAGLLSVIVVASITALFAWGFDSLSMSGMRTLSATNPMGGMAAGAYWMLNTVFPVATLLSCLLARASFNLYASTIFAGCAAAARFVVP